MSTNTKYVVKPNFKDGLAPGHPAIPLLESLAKSSTAYTAIIDDFGDVIELHDSHSSFRLPDIAIGVHKFPAPILTANEIDRCLAQAKLKYESRLDVVTPQPVERNRDTLLLFVCKNIFKGTISVPKLNILLDMSLEQLRQLVLDYERIDKKVAADETRKKINEIDAKIVELSNEKTNLLNSLTQYNESIEDFSVKYSKLLS